MSTPDSRSASVLVNREVWKTGWSNISTFVPGCDLGTVFNLWSLLVVLHLLTPNPLCLTFSVPWSWLMWNTSLKLHCQVTFSWFGQWEALQEVENGSKKRSWTYLLPWCTFQHPSWLRFLPDSCSSTSQIPLGSGDTPFLPSLFSPKGGNSLPPLVVSRFFMTLSASLTLTMKSLFERLPSKTLPVPGQTIFSLLLRCSFSFLTWYFGCTRSLFQDCSTHSPLGGGGHGWWFSWLCPSSGISLSRSKPPCPGSHPSPYKHGSYPVVHWSVGWGVRYIKWNLLASGLENLKGPFQLYLSMWDWLKSSLTLHCCSTPLPFILPILPHQCCSWQHSPVNFLGTHPIVVFFPLRTCPETMGSWLMSKK